MDGYDDIDIHPIERKMDPIKINVLRDGEIKRISFTDLTDKERAICMETKDVQWLRRMCEILAVLINDPFAWIKDAEEMSDPVYEEPEQEDDEVPEEVKQKNRELCGKYPFIKPDGTSEDFDYSYTMLDYLPAGWVKAFGEQLCSDLWDAVKDDPDCENFSIRDWRERYCGLVIYPSNYTAKVSDVIWKYERMSERTCWMCGKPATKYSNGYVLPWCDDCAAGFGGSFMSAEEYFGGGDDDV